MNKTKLEYLKDLATAIQGLKVNSEITYKLAVENLGQDYGLYQIIALLELAAQDLSHEIYAGDLLQEGIDTNPNHNGTETIKQFPR